MSDIAYHQFHQGGWYYRLKLQFFFLFSLAKALFLIPQKFSFKKVFWYRTQFIFKKGKLVRPQWYECIEPQKHLLCRWFVV